MPVVADRLAPVTLLGAGNTLLLTVPDSRTAVVRAEYFNNFAGLPVTVSLLVDTPGEAIAQLEAVANPVPALGSLPLERWFVLRPGDELYGACSTASVCTVWLFGYMLAGVTPAWP